MGRRNRERADCAVSVPFIFGLPKVCNSCTGGLQFCTTPCIGTCILSSMWV